MTATLDPGTTIGVVGLGRMGIPMARRLHAAGYRVRAYDVSSDQRAVYAGTAGAAAETDLAAVADGAKAVVLLLPSSQAVADVLGPPGLLDRIEAGAIVLDMGSSQPLRTRELAAAATAAGAELIDAPVSGGVVGAEAGSLTIMVGGEAEQFSRCRPLFDVLGKTVLHVGPVGAGHALKALNNLLSAASLAATSEALAVGERFGLSLTTMLDAINVSSGRSFSTEFKFPQFVVPETFASGFSLRLMAKDARTALDLGETLGARLELSSQLVSLWEQAVDELPADADHTRIAQWIAERPAAG